MPKQIGRHGGNRTQRTGGNGELEIAVPLCGGGAIGFAGPAFGAVAPLAAVSGGLPGITTTRVPT